MIKKIKQFFCLHKFTHDAERYEYIKYYFHVRNVCSNCGKVRIRHEYKTEEGVYKTINVKNE